MVKKSLLFLALSAACALSAGAVEIIHGPYLQNLGSDFATIVWITDSSTVGWVEIAPDDGSEWYGVARPRFYDAPDGVKITSTVHSVRIGGLTEATAYRYRVFGTEVRVHDGNDVYYGETRATSPRRDILKFKTQNSGAAAVSFAVVNDIHEDKVKLGKLVSQCDLDSTDFFFFNGDMSSSINTQEQIFGGFMDTVISLFATRIPAYYARGNHETRGERAATDFRRYFANDREHIYFTMRKGPVFFIMLDCGEDKCDDDIEYYGITDYDAYRSTEAEWLKGVLDSDEYKDAPFKVVLCHMPFVPGWHGQNDLRDKMLEMLNDASPDIMISAHYHSYGHSKAGENAVFPVIINDDATVLKACADEHCLKIEVVDTLGKKVDSFAIPRR